MKKQMIFFIVFIFMLNIPIIYSNSEIIKYENWKNGEIIKYDVSNYNELYSVFEDLEYDYNRLLEQYHSLEVDNEDKDAEIESLQQELDNIKQMQLNNKDSFSFFYGLLIIFIIYVIYEIFNHIKTKIIQKRKMKLYKKIEEFHNEVKKTIN